MSFHFRWTSFSKLKSLHWRPTSMHEGLAGGRKGACRWAAPNTIISMASWLSFSRGVVQVWEGLWVGSGKSEPWLKEQETTAWMFSGTQCTGLPWFHKTKELTAKLTKYEEAPPSAPKVLTQLRNHTVREMKRSAGTVRKGISEVDWREPKNPWLGCERHMSCAHKGGCWPEAIVRDPCLLDCPPQSTRGVQTWITLIISVRVERKLLISSLTTLKDRDKSP